MQLGIDKCRELHLKRGVINAELDLDNKSLTEIMSKDESYKYLLNLLSILPEDRRGAPRATAGGHRMRENGNGELTDG